jgi:hypothetical protein
LGIGPKRDPGRLAEQSTVSETMLGARVEQRLLAGESIVADCIHCDDPSPARLVQRLGESLVGAPGADIHTVTPGGGVRGNQRINPVHQLSPMLYRYPFRPSGTTELGSTSPSRGMVARITSAT